MPRLAFRAMVAAAERYEIVRETAPLLVRMWRTTASFVLGALSMSAGAPQGAEASHPGGDRICVVDRSSKAKLASFTDSFGQSLDMQAHLEEDLVVLSADEFAEKWLSGAAPDLD